MNYALRTYMWIVLLSFVSADVYAERKNANAFIVVEKTAYSKTEKRWRKAHKDRKETDAALLAGGNFPVLKLAVYIGPLEGNGLRDNKHRNKRRDTIIAAPLSTDFAKPVDLIFWFHGLGGFGAHDFENRILTHLTVPPMTSNNFVVVIPEMPWSQNTRTPRARQGRAFAKKGDWATFVASVKRQIVLHLDPGTTVTHVCRTTNNCALKEGNTILIGHSAGGSTLKALAKSSALNTTPRLTRVVFSDASYGRWLDSTWRALKRQPRTELIVLTQKYGKPAKSVKRLFRHSSGASDTIALVVYKDFSHKDIGDLSLLYAYLDPLDNYTTEYHPYEDDADSYAEDDCAGCWCNE